MSLIRLALIALLVTAGCDRHPAPAPPPAPPAPPVTIERVAAMSPGRPTHLASDGAGQVCWVQEPEGSAAELLFTLTDGAFPEATKFGAGAIVAALGQPKATGIIQSLAFGPDGNLYFYFLGEQRRQLLATFGCFIPRSGQVKIIADAASLMKTSGLGHSLALARGTVVRSGSLVWLWLRHTDDFALLWMDLDRVGATLRRPFERLHGADDPLRLTGAADDLSGGTAGWIMWLDRRSGQLWKIDPLGEVSQLANLSDLPRNCTMPLLDPRGRMVIVAPAGESAAELEDPLIRLTNRPVQYPALVLTDQSKRQVFERPSIQAPAAISLQDLSPGAAVLDRASLLLYNTPTGELLRVKFESEK